MVVSRRRVQVADPAGLHMRPAGRFVTLAIRFRSEVLVLCDGNRADGKSLLDLLGLAAPYGATLDVCATGPDAVEAVATLAELVCSNDGPSFAADTDNATGSS